MLRKFSHILGSVSSVGATALFNTTRGMACRRTEKERTRAQSMAEVAFELSGQKNVRRNKIFLRMGKKSNPEN